MRNPLAQYRYVSLVNASKAPAGMSQMEWLQALHGAPFASKGPLAKGMAGASRLKRARLAMHGAYCKLSPVVEAAAWV